MASDPKKALVLVKNLEALENHFKFLEKRLTKRVVSLLWFKILSSKKKNYWKTKALKYKISSKLHYYKNIHLYN